MALPCTVMASSLFDELIADSIHRQHISWIEWVGLDLSTQILDVRVDAAIETLVDEPMHAIHQLLARKRLPRMLRQHRQQVEFAASQVQRFAAAGDAVTLKVDLDIPGPDEPGAMYVPLGAAQNPRTRATSSRGENGLTT